MALDNLEYLKIRRHHYLAARRATLMERQPTTPQQPNSTEDAFATEWKRAHELSQHHSEEGTNPPPYFRLHQRNYSSGNLDEYRLRPDMKLSPLVKKSLIVDNGPQKTVIYPENRTPSEIDPEKVKLLILDHIHNDDKDDKDENSKS